MLTPHPIEEDECLEDEKMEESASTIGIRGVVHRIWEQEGISGFYRALSSQLLCIFVSDMVYFFAVTLVKQVLYGKREVDAMSNLKASSIAGMLNVFCTAPFWRAQVLLMLQSKREQQNNELNQMEEEEEEDKMKGLLDAWKRIVTQDGI